MTRREIRDSIRVNLADIGQGYYSDEEFNDSIQDAYNDICSRSLCIVKTYDFNFRSSNYYDFKALGVSDFLGAMAIFNHNTNLYLFDHLNIRDFDRMRIDWECWFAEPIFWAPHSLNKVALLPKHYTPVGYGTLTYWANAPLLVYDDDVPVIATDVQTAFEHYCTADLLETAAEPQKAMQFWKQYEESILEYKRRCRSIATSDLRSRV